MSIAQNIEELRKELPAGVTLLAVSKTKPLEDLEKAYKVGIRDFGENKVQELMSKEENFHKDVRWHFIGKLQTNKVKYLVSKVFLIHSLSSIKLLNQIEKEFGKHDQMANVLIEINIGMEDSKSGILPNEIDELIDEIEKCSHVKAKGIMVIIPKGTSKSNREYFKKTKNIFEKYKKNNYKNVTMEILSMGMTHDYSEAIEEGSTLVRIGTGIFGEREYNLGGNGNE